MRWNRNAEKVTGYSSSEMSNLKPLDLIADADKKMVLEGFEKALDNVDTSMQLTTGPRQEIRFPIFLQDELLKLIIHNVS